MRKKVIRLFLALGGSVLVIGCAVFWGGREVAEKYFTQEQRIGSGTLRFVGPQLKWGLNMSLDSLLYKSQELELKVGRTQVAINLFRSLIHFSPTVQLKTDTLNIWVFAGHDSAKKNLDSLPFPDFKIPADLLLKATGIKVSDSLGTLFSCKGVRVESRNPKTMRIYLDSLGSRFTGPLQIFLRGALDWQGHSQVKSTLSIYHGKDSIDAKLEMEKKNLLLGQADLKIRMRSSRPYHRVLNLPVSMPQLEFFKGAFQFKSEGAYTLTSTISTRLTGLPNHGAWKFNSQQVNVNLDWKESQGRWSVLSEGILKGEKNQNQGGPRNQAAMSSMSARLEMPAKLEKPEAVRLQGALFLNKSLSGPVFRADSLKNPAYLVRHLGATASGQIEEIKVIVAGKCVPADLKISEALASREAIKAKILSGDGSEISLQFQRRQSLSQGASPQEWRAWVGDFSMNLIGHERWLTAFTDTQVVFKALQIRGKVKQGYLTAESQVFGLKAYGLFADSAKLFHEYNSRGYRLQPSLWFWEGITWKVTSAKPMALRFESGLAGSVEAIYQHKKSIQVQAQSLQVAKLPYRGLASWDSIQPRVSGVFFWNQQVDTGYTKLNLKALYKGEALEAKTAIQWSREFLEIGDLEIEAASSAIKARSKLRMHGRPFYALSQLKLEDVVGFELHSSQFDLARVLSLVLPKSPLKAGNFLGSFVYQEAQGFRGHYQFQGLELAPETMPFLARDQGAMEIKALNLYGEGDTLRIKAITESAVQPWLKDSITVNLTGALTQKQSLGIHVRSAMGLNLGFQGFMHEYRDIEGTLSLDGKAVLPNKSGEIQNLRVRAQGAMVFHEGLPSLKLNADTLRGEYAIAGIDTQSFSTSLQTRDFRIILPDLVVKSRSGELRGRLDYAVKDKRLVATLNGQSLAVQLGGGTKFQIRNFQIDAQADSNAFNLKAAIGNGSFEHVKSPLRAAGDLSKINLAYYYPLGQSKVKSQGNGQIPVLKLGAILDSSALRYRIRTLDALQGLFKKSPARKHASPRTKPMQVNIQLETAGTGNLIETDILRMAYVGNLSMVGIYPYTLMQGRLTGREGFLGTKKQSYRIRHFEVKWLNTPLEEGRLEMDSEKKLARTCESNETDSCSVSMRLGGALNNMQFSYDSDCQGSYGAGVQVSALVYSVRRGCYSSAFASSGGGLSYQEQALTLLETPLNGYLSEAAEKLSGKWIASAQVTGLGALAQSGQNSSSDTASASAPEGASRDAIALEILSKEFWRLRLRARSAYQPDIPEKVNPWAYLVGLEWRPPIFRYIDNPAWKRRIKNNVSMALSLFTDPIRSQSSNQSEILKRAGLNYNYDFWGYWWTRSADEAPLNSNP